MNEMLNPHVIAQSLVETMRREYVPDSLLSVRLQGCGWERYTFHTYERKKMTADRTIDTNQSTLVLKEIVCSRCVG